MQSGVDFHLFKENIEPKWEDPMCEGGGKWTVLVPKGPDSKAKLDTYWLNTVRYGLGGRAVGVIGACFGLCWCPWDMIIAKLLAVFDATV